MKKYRITKTLHFCYGHRLLDYDGPCRNLHGHNARLEIDLAAEALDKRGMVEDFSLVGAKAKAWIDACLDHRMLLNEKDPLLPLLKKSGEPVFVLNGNPTAENIAARIFAEIRGMGFPVSEVRLWETPHSVAACREEGA